MLFNIVYLSLLNDKCGGDKYEVIWLAVSGPT